MINTELVASSYPSGLLQVRLCLGNPASREPFPGFPILLMGVACLTVPGFGVMRLEKERPISKPLDYQVSHLLKLKAVLPCTPL